MGSTSFWSWSGWGAFEALGTVAAAMVAVTVYLTEVGRRRRAERNSVRVWAGKEAGRMILYIANDSNAPIVDTRILALYQEAAWIGWRPGINWSAVGWIGRGPDLVHPSQTVRLTFQGFRGNSPGIPEILPPMAVLQLTYEASAEKRQATFHRIKTAPRRRTIVGVGLLEIDKNAAPAISAKP